MSAWMQTARGRPIDLVSLGDRPIVGDVAGEIAWPLAGLARFSAHQVEPAPRIYSVAQHCVIGADAVLRETGSAESALAFLVHDAHEALIGDITTPAVQAIETYVATVLRHVFGLNAEAQVRRAIGRGAVGAAIDALKAALDGRIHRLAGLPMTLPDSMAATVRDMDRRMLDLERRQILGPTRMPPGEEIWPAAVRAAELVRITGRLRPWSRAMAAGEWMTRFEAWRLGQ